MYSILDSKALLQLPQLAGDKLNFRIWNDRMINAMAQVRRGTRVVFQSLMEHADQDREGEFEKLFPLSPEGLEAIAQGVDLEELNEDLYTLLVEKA